MLFLSQNPVQLHIFIIFRKYVRLYRIIMYYVWLHWCVYVMNDNKLSY